MTVDLSGADFDVEVVALVGDLEDLGPREPADAQLIAVDEQTRCTDADHDVHALLVLPARQSLVSQRLSLAAGA